MDNQLAVFEQKEIRRVEHNGEMYFSIIDIIEVLTDSTNPRKYWSVLKVREPQLTTNCSQLKLKSADGKNYKTDCSNTEGVFRILMFVPSPKAEPFKLWLAQGNKQVLKEVEKPKLLMASQEVLTTENSRYDALIDKIGQLLSKGRQKAAYAIENIMVETYKEMRFDIAKYEKNGKRKAEDIIREPLVLDFLGIPDNYDYKESELEQRILDNLQKFLLELGRGFAFVGRQYRIPIANKNYKVDLVFYHYILHCFVIIDLKRGEVEHYDIGQMNMYLSYFKKEENTEGDNAPIGIILTAEKDNVLIEYALDGITNQILVSKYQLYLPNRDVLEAQIKRILERENEL